MFEDIISLHNLFGAWEEFVRGKKSKNDVAEFSLTLSHNLFLLHADLKHKRYVHGGYKAFKISDPKPRDIHKAPVRDRVLHHAIYRVLYPYFDRKFISQSYSCRDEKGIHLAIRHFERHARKVSKNNTRTCWVLKCDIRKFFASIDHATLLRIVRKHIEDRDVIWLLERVIKSFSTSPGKGMPLGNLTSQLLVNAYMNEFDQYMKHTLREKNYVRYADDFMLLSDDREHLEKNIPVMRSFLEDVLHLSLHPRKVFIKSWASGVDILGWISFPDHKVLRTSTKRRMMRRVKENPTEEVLNSYLGLLSHGNAYKLKRSILDG